MSVRNAVTRIPNHEHSVPFARIFWSCAGFGLAVGFLELFAALVPDSARLRRCDGWMHRAVERACAASDRHSLGLASVEQGEKETLDCEAFLRNADEALYAAKARGRNRVETAPASRAAGA